MRQPTKVFCLTGLIIGFIFHGSLMKRNETRATDPNAVKAHRIKPEPEDSGIISAQPRRDAVMSGENQG